MLQRYFLEQSFTLKMEKLAKFASATSDFVYINAGDSEDKDLRNCRDQRVNL